MPLNVFWYLNVKISVKTSIGVIVIISRPSHSPFNRQQSVICGCHLTHMEQSASACHSCTLSQYFVVALWLNFSLFLSLNLYFSVQCLQGDSFHLGHLNRYSYIYRKLVILKRKKIFMWLTKVNCWLEILKWYIKAEMFLGIPCDGQLGHVWRITSGNEHVIHRTSKHSKNIDAAIDDVF